MKNAVIYAGMVAAYFAQVGQMIVSKKAMSTGMTNISFTFYTNVVASLLLLPSSLLVHRSNPPPLSFSLLRGFVMLGVLGFLAQILGYAGIDYASASLCSAMLNLVPGFVFILAIIFRIETVACGSANTQAKSIGTVVSTAGAIIVTLYKGPTILTTKLHSIVPNHLLSQSSEWIIGGVFLGTDCVFSSMFTIAQALILEKYSAELILVFAYCFVVAILSGFVSLIRGGDLSAFSLQPTMRLFAIIYSEFLAALSKSQ